jgi:hypothetical protein
MTALMRAPSNLETRIPEGFGRGATSGGLAALIGEVDAAVSAAGEAADRERARAMDPMLSAGDVAAARHLMDDNAFRRDRLSVAAAKLRDRLRDVREAEEQERRQVAYDKIKTSRDALAEELARLYPEMAAQLVDLMSRILANDSEICRMDLPAAAEPLLGAELTARKLAGFVQNSVEALPITRELRLPAWKHTVHKPYAWPPQAR